MNRKFIVYKHENKLNGKVYIGITSQSPEKRWQGGKGYVQCTTFYRAIKKYGWDGFEHIILYEGLDNAEACQIEKDLIIYYKKLNLSYNILNGANDIGEYVSRKINVYALNGMFIKTCDSIYQAAVEFNVSESGIYYCATKYRGTTKWKGYIFLFPHDSIDERLYTIATYKRVPPQLSIESRKKISNYMKSRVVSEETRRKMRANRLGKAIVPIKKVRMLSSEGKPLKVFNSIKEASEYIGKPHLHSKISDCCKGKRNKTGGYKWEYV